MRIAKHLTTVSFLIAVSSAGFVTNGWAQSGRDAAMQKCLAQARAEFPSTSTGDALVDRNRSQAYISCMTSAGYTP